MPEKITAANRKHQILEAREDQLLTNLLAYAGGQPYIEARLSRMPAESDTDFLGDASQVPPSLGRRDRAIVVNYMRRIATKINQYVFASGVAREKMDPKYGADITATGVSLNQFMADVSSALTVQRWCWAGVDRPAMPTPRSVAAGEKSGDRIFWRLYNATDVVDWRYDISGKLSWLVTADEEYDNSDPESAATVTPVRYLWKPGQVTRMAITKKDGNTVVTREDIPFGLQEVPFLQIGLISADPWWADEVERIQRCIMDLLSSRDTQIFRAVFALLVVSQSFAAETADTGSKTKEARRKIGVGNPIVEAPEDKGLTRYLAPPPEVFQVIGDAVKQLEAQLYEIVGLNMSVPESRQVASAEAKSWDHLDPETVLAERATILEETENKLVELSARLGGPNFTPWTAKYSKAFDISDFKADMEGILTATNLVSSPRAGAMIERAAIKSIAREFDVEDAERDAALADVEAVAKAAQTAVA